MNKKTPFLKKPAPGDWPPHYLLYRLRDSGTSYARISRLNGYCPTAALMANQAPWPKMERLIADAIGVTPQEIWPSRYNADGTPVRGLRTHALWSDAKRKQNMAQPSARDNVEVSEAA